MLQQPPPLIDASPLAVFKRPPTTALLKLLALLQRPAPTKLQLADATLA
jgi:hypothetical protein